MTDQKGYKIEKSVVDGVETVVVIPDSVGLKKIKKAAISSKNDDQ